MCLWLSLEKNRMKPKQLSRAWSTLPTKTAALWEMYLCLRNSWSTRSKVVCKTNRPKEVNPSNPRPPERGRKSQGKKDLALKLTQGWKGLGLEEARRRTGSLQSVFWVSILVQGQYWCSARMIMNIKHLLSSNGRCARHRTKQFACTILCDPPGLLSRLTCYLHFANEEPEAQGETQRPAQGPG